MAENTRCTLCHHPGTVDTATDRQQVPSNVSRFHSEKFTMWRCGNCRSIHCLEDVDLAHYYEGYPLNGVALSLPIRMAYRNRLKQMQRSGLQPSHRILDYGCGGGLFLAFLKDHGYSHVSGYDAFTPQFADEDVLKPSHYDFLVSYDVIEHVEDPSAYLMTLTLLAKPGGCVIIATPRAEGVLLKETHVMELHPPYHRHILSEAALLRLAEEHGLKAQHVYRRSLVDSPIPTLNMRFINGYVEKSGGVLESVMNSPAQPLRVITSPKLLFLGLFGYFLSRHEHMSVTLQKP